MTAVAIGTASLVVLAPHAAAAPATTPPAVSEADAIATAKLTGIPVEITDLTTETQQILANPEGTFTFRSNTKPVRVKKNGVWQDINATLRSDVDGSLTPTATAQQVAFSGGGDQPLITVRDGDKSLSFSWPTPLPKPKLDGATATYPDVLPGVDLTVTAAADSYSQVLVVKDAATAANPALRSISLRANGSGVSVAPQSDGRLVATDPAGTEVFRGPRPLMWDSRTGVDSGLAPSATDHGSGRVSALGVSGKAIGTAPGPLTTTELTLVPDPAALSGPDVTYPVYIDPAMGVRKQHWTEVTSNGWHYYDDANQVAQVGYCSGWTDCGSTAWKARSYFNMDTSPLVPRNGKTATIWRANFYAHQIWSADHNCQGGQPTAIYESGLIDAGTRWPGPASVHLDTQSSNAGGPCPQSDVAFNVKAAAERAATYGWASTGFGLIAADETNKYQWKKFTNDPYLEVVFSFPPNAATDLAVSNQVVCDGKVYTPDAKPVLSAVATDNNNPPLNPALWFHVWAADDSREAPGGGGIRIASGTRGSWAEPDDLGNDNWKFRVYVDNNPGTAENLNAGFSPWYFFTTISEPIRFAPKVSSPDYPGQYWGAPADVPGTMTFDAAGSENIAGFTYSMTGPGTQVVPSATDCAYDRTFGSGLQGWVSNNHSGLASFVMPTGLAPGRHTMHVRSFDFAHKLSPETEYVFYVAPQASAPFQRIEAESATISAPTGQTLQPVVYACCGFSGGSEVVLWSTAVGQSFTMRTSVSTTADYEVLLQMAKSSHYGRVTFAIDGQAAGTEFDAYTVAPGPTTAHSLGRKRLTAGQHDITVTVSGTNPASQGSRYIAGVDTIVLRGLTEFEAEDSSQVTLGQPAGQSVPVTTQSNCCRAFTVEAETTTLSAPSGQSLQPAIYACCGFSGGSEVVLWNDTQGRSFSMATSVPTTGDYEIVMQMIQSPHYGKVSFAVDGQAVGTAFDSYYAFGSAAPHSLGSLRLTAGTHTITATSSGTNAASQGARYIIGVDSISFRPAPVWSNTGQVAFAPTSAGKSLTMSFNVPIEADHALGVALATGPQHGEVRVDLTKTGEQPAPVNGTDTAPLNANAPTPGVKFFPLGGAHLTSGTYTLTVTSADTNADNRFLIGVDYFSVTRLNNITVTDFTAAMNNDGIGSDGATAANLDLVNQSALSAQTLATAGFSPQSTVRVNGAAFTMPAPKTDGADNVIAIGQRIPLSAAQQVNASAVGLLVAATCGTIPKARVAITYTDGTVDRPELPAVADWVTGPAAGAALVLPYRNIGTAPATTSMTVKVYAVFATANPTKTIAAVTLPNHGSSLLPGECRPTMHVLSMAPRPVDAGWTGVWAAPADTAVAVPGGLANQTLRTAVRPSATGQNVRIRLANPYTTSAVTIGAASVSAQSADGAVSLAAPTTLRFGGSTQVTLPAGGEIVSDAVAFPPTAGGSGNLLVSLHIPTAVALVPQHYSPSARTWSATGEQTANSTGTPFTTALTGSRYLVGVDATASESIQGTVVVLGDQLTSNAPGQGTTWVDLLPGRVDPPLPGGLVDASLAGANATGQWRLAETSGSTAADSAGTATATATGGTVAWNGERGGSVSLTTGVLATSGPVLNTRRGYTLSAWAKPASVNGYRSVISQSGANTGGINLQYREDSGTWSFVATNSDAANATSSRVNGGPATANAWTHLAATYDADGKTISLYVNGQFKGTTAYTGAWTTPGPLAIGGAKLIGGTVNNQFHGLVSDVRVFQRTADAAEVWTLFTGGPVVGAQPGLGALSAANASRTLESTVFTNPAVRTVMLSLGANDVLAGRSQTEIKQDLLTTSMRIQSRLRANGDPVKVLITTIAPLGLAAGDPREAVRQAVNADINAAYDDYGAHGKVDVASALQDSGNASAVNPAYVTGGQPNASYHSAITDAVATAASTWPPEIEF